MFKLLNFSKNFYFCFYKSIKDTIHHDGIEHSGYLAFLLMLSIFPFLFFLMSIITFIGPVDLSEQIIYLVTNSEFDDLISVLKPRIKEITDFPPHSLLTFAILSAIWTASSIFDAIRNILNKSNRITNPPSYLFRRFISIIEFMIIIFTTIFIMFIFGIIPSILSNVVSFFELKNFSDYIIFKRETKVFRNIIIISYGYFLISFLYYFLPNKKQKFANTMPGTFCVMTFWIIFTYLFNYYLKTFSQLNIIYGSIVGVIVSLLYFYFCSIIFIFGAEFNYNFFVIFCKKKKLLHNRKSI